MSYIKLFLCMTAVFSVMSFHFYKTMSDIIRFVSIYCIDEYIPTYGIYTNKLPINIISVKLDNQVYNNKFLLHLNWFWDFESGGFNIKDYPVDFKEMHIVYKIRMSNEIKNIIIYKDLNTITRNNIIEDILFNECVLI